MPKFRKKPVEVEAFQLTPENRVNHESWPAWMNEAWNKDREQEGALYPADYPNSKGDDELKIFTLEGLHHVSFGDWIILGVKGEIYACKPDIFEATYEAVE